MRRPSSTVNGLRLVILEEEEAELTEQASESSLLLTPCQGRVGGLLLKDSDRADAGVWIAGDSGAVSYSVSVSVSRAMAAPVLTLMSPEAASVLDVISGVSVGRLTCAEKLRTAGSRAFCTMGVTAEGGCLFLMAIPLDLALSVWAELLVRFNVELVGIASEGRFLSIWFPV